MSITTKEKALRHIYKLNASAKAAGVLQVEIEKFGVIGVVSIKSLHASGIRCVGDLIPENQSKLLDSLHNVGAKKWAALAESIEHLISTGKFPQSKSISRDVSKGKIPLLALYEEKFSKKDLLPPAPFSAYEILVQKLTGRGSLQDSDLIVSKSGLLTGKAIPSSKLAAKKGYSFERIRQLELQVLSEIEIETGLFYRLFNIIKLAEKNANSPIPFVDLVKVDSEFFKAPENISKELFSYLIPKVPGYFLYEIDSELMLAPIPMTRLKNLLSACSSILSQAGASGEKAKLNSQKFMKESVEKLYEMYPYQDTVDEDTPPPSFKCKSHEEAEREFRFFVFNKSIEKFIFVPVQGLPLMKDKKRSRFLLALEKMPAPSSIEDVIAANKDSDLGNITTLRNFCRTSPDVFLFGRGVYGVKKHIGLSDSQIKEALDFIFSKKESLVGVNIHVEKAFELLPTKIKKSKGLNPYSLYNLMMGDSRFVGNGYNHFSFADSLMAEQSDQDKTIYRHSDLVIRVLEDRGEPLKTADLKKLIPEAVNSKGIFQIYPRRGLAPIGRGYWGLFKRDYKMSRPISNAIKTSLLDSEKLTCRDLYKTFNMYSKVFADSEKLPIGFVYGLCSYLGLKIEKADLGKKKESSRLNLDSLVKITEA